MRNSLVLGLLVALVLGFGAIAESPPSHPKIEWTLLELAKNVNPSGLALADKGGRIRAILESDSILFGFLPILSSLGISVEAQYENLLQVWIPLENLIFAAELPGVVYIRRPYTPIPLGEGPRLVTEGLTLLGASLFHARGILGQGVKVAIIDVGFSSLTNAFRAGEMNAAAVVWARDYTGEGLEAGSPHGTAVAQIVHNLAPQAELYLARVSTEVELAQAVSDCIQLGVDVIVHCLGWPNTECGDGTGVVSDLVRKASQAGIFWVNAAGNHAQRHWQGVPTLGPDGWIQFGPDLSQLEIAVTTPGFVQVALTWDEWPRATSDLDLFLFDAQGNVVRASRSEQSGYAPPTEYVSSFVEPGKYFVRVLATRLFSPVRVKIFSLNHDLRPSVPEGSILPPGTAAEAFAIGAVGIETWPRGPQRPFSSQGPTLDGRLKPDLMGPDGVRNFVYPSFLGTSAAAPHVAGLAALLLCQSRVKGAGLSLQELRDTLVRWAVDLGEPGPDPIYGHGCLRVFLERTVAQRTILTPNGGPLSPGESATVVITVHMPSTQLGSLEVREIIPLGLHAEILDADGAEIAKAGQELRWRWPLLFPGEERRASYRLTAPVDFPPGEYQLQGWANLDPIEGAQFLRVVPGNPLQGLRLLAFPNPVTLGAAVSFFFQGITPWELRVWIYDVSGRLVFDSGWQPGPAYQWALQDQRGRLVAAGLYLCRAEVRMADGRLLRSGLERLLVLR